MPRSTMLPVIARLRNMTDAATDDVFNGVTWWSDDQLEDVLDDNSAPLVDLTLTPSTMLVSGVVDWRTQFFKPLRAYDYERDAQVVTANGTPLAGTDFTIDWLRFTVTLAVGVTNNVDYFLRVRLYDMWDSAARVWYQKAEQRTAYITVRAGNNRLDMKPERDHCIDRAIYYRSRRIKVLPR